MSRYIYDEIKQEFFDEYQIELKPGLIIKFMANVTHEMGYTAPGMIPENRVEEFKRKVKMCIKRYINSIGTGIGWLSISNLDRS